jgi:hypothetical protein
MSALVTAGPPKEGADCMARTTLCFTDTIGPGHPYSHIMDYEPGRVLIIIL